MNNMFEKKLYFDSDISDEMKATKSNIIKNLDLDGVISIDVKGMEYYLADVNKLNALHAKGHLKPILKSFVSHFSSNVEYNKLKASSSGNGLFLPAEDGNYALMTKLFKPVGKMLFDTLDEVINELKVEYVKENPVNEILNGKPVRETLLR